MSRRRVVPRAPWQALPSSYRELLRGLGYTKRTYEKLQQAEALLDQINRATRRRRGNVRFSVTYVAGPADYLWKRR